MTTRFLRLLSGLAFTVALIHATPAEATSITVSDTYNWTGTTLSDGTTFATFTEPSQPSWSHSLTFVPPAVSFTSAQVSLRHMGNRANAQQEVWLMQDGALTQLIGTLSGSGNSATGNAFVIDTFSIPGALLPSFPAGTWTLALRLTDTNSGTNTISLDYATLTVVYNDGVTQVPAAVPEPGSLLLLGSGLVGLGALVRRRRRQA